MPWRNWIAHQNLDLRVLREHDDEKWKAVKELGYELVIWFNEDIMNYEKDKMWKR